MGNKDNDKNKQILYIMYGTAAFLAIFYTMHIATLQASNPKMGIADLMSKGLTHMCTKPFTIVFSSAMLTDIALVFLIGGMFALNAAVTRDRERGVMKKDQSGSAKWNKSIKNFNARYADKTGKRDMILSDKVRLTMDTRQTMLNCNIMIIGGTGTGKSRFFVKPNVLQANCSYVITDPAGDLLKSLGGFLEAQGYKVKCINLINMTRSDHYNPFNYIRNEDGILMLVNCLLKNTNPDGKKGGDPFWDDTMMLLLSSLVAYLYFYRPKEEQNFVNVMKLLLCAEVDENNPDSVKSKLDLLFDEVAEKDKASFAAKQYKLFKMAAGKTLKSILISCGSRMKTINIANVSNLIRDDTVQLKKFGDEKTALFVIISATDDTYNWLISMLYSQLFDTLYYHGDYECKYIVKSKSGEVIMPVEDKKDAETIVNRLKNAKLCQSRERGIWIGYLKHEGFNFARDSNLLVFRDHLQENEANRLMGMIKEGLKIEQQKSSALPIPVRFILDEFANIGQIPDFQKKLATMRKYDISCSIILQSINQIKALYKDDWGDLIGNCSTFIYLGGQDLDTSKYISEKLGKTTIRIKNNSVSKSARGGNFSNSYNTTARNLLDPNEVSGIDPGECIIMITGVDPFLTPKYDYPRHPNYKYTADADGSLSYVFKPSNEVIGSETKHKAWDPDMKEANELIKTENKDKSSSEIGFDLDNIDSIQVEKKKVGQKEISIAKPNRSNKDDVMDLDQVAVSTEYDTECWDYNGMSM